MFENAVLDGGMRRGMPRGMWAAAAVNVLVPAAMVGMPLIFPQGLPARLLREVLYVPPARVEPMAEPVRVEKSAATGMAKIALRSSLQMPRVIPRRVDTEAAPTPVGIGESMLLDGVGSQAGSPGGAETGVFQKTTARVLAQTPKSIHVSEGVEAGRLLIHPAPVYPVIAKAAGIAGTVVLAATIDREGGIANVQVVSGPGMLREAAKEAVARWRYRPFLLNREPVEVETTVTVVFSLGR